MWGSGAPSSNRWMYYRDHKIGSNANGKSSRRHTESTKIMHVDSFFSLLPISFREFHTHDMKCFMSRPSPLKNSN